MLQGRRGQLGLRTIRRGRPTPRTSTADSRYAYLQAGGEDFFGSEQPASQYADQVLHEVLHTLGAVQPSAPHFSGGAHCYQLFDVMCYTPRDGTSDGFLRDCELGRMHRTPASRWTAGAMTTQLLAGAGLLPGRALEPLRLGLPVHAGTL